jgi:hypothetical protein
MITLARPPLSFALLGMIACGGAGGPVERPMSAHDHMAAADVSERRAADHDRQARAEPASGPAIECLDQPLAGIPYSGTEPLQILRPCWSTHADPDRTEAERLRKVAARHRDAAADLIGAEQRACAGLGEDEISHSPLYHREDIVRVDPYVEGGVLRGAMVLIAPVEGLTATWLRRSFHCQQTRAAVLGYPTTFNAYCPSSLRGVSVAVTEVEDGFVVTLRSTRDEVAAAVLGRAIDLVAGQQRDR